MTALRRERTLREFREAGGGDYYTDALPADDDDTAFHSVYRLRRDGIFEPIAYGDAATVEGRLVNRHGFCAGCGNYAPLTFDPLCAACEAHPYDEQPNDPEWTPEKATEARNYVRELRSEQAELGAIAGDLLSNSLA